MEGSGLHGIAELPRGSASEDASASIALDAIPFECLDFAAPRQESFSEADDVRLSPTYLACKRAVDVVGALMIAIALSPAILAITALLLGSGQIIYGQARVGRSGRPFTIYKFRSMVTNADEVLEHLLAADPQARAEWRRDFKLRNDPRITPLGNFLRRSSLDELPQLWNVLRGEMSLVGPRPIIDAELEKYGRAARYYLAVKPGVTGFWQVTGRNDTDYRRRVAMDRRYARTASLWGDVRLLFRTVLVVLSMRGAY